jgi:hypothetical protein
MFKDEDEGKRFIYEWQYGMAGDFKTALAEAMCKADNTNLAKLALGFPAEVDAFIKYSRVNGWWQEVQARLNNERNKL